MAKITASKLREHVYTILDEVLETGKPVEILRRGKVLRIIPEVRGSKLGRLKKRSCVRGSMKDLDNLDWSNEWSEVK